MNTQRRLRNESDQLVRILGEDRSQRDPPTGDFSAPLPAPDWLTHSSAPRGRMRQPGWRNAIDEKIRDGGLWDPPPRTS
jgi:hypothetical protein